MAVKRSGGGIKNPVRLSSAMKAALKPVVHAIADQVRADAQVSITTGAVSGKNHVPSLPGEPPNNDEGTLAKGIIVEIVDDLTARVVSTAAHGAPLELGTSKMAERPYMRPAGLKNKERGQRQMRAAVEHVLKGGKF
jgi:hypothetical protein